MGWWGGDDGGDDDGDDDVDDDDDGDDDDDDVDDEGECKSPPRFPLIVRRATNSARAIKQISGFFLPGFFGQSFAFQIFLGKPGPQNRMIFSVLRKGGGGGGFRSNKLSSRSVLRIWGDISEFSKNSTCFYIIIVLVHCVELVIVQMSSMRYGLAIWTYKNG